MVRVRPKSEPLSPEKKIYAEESRVSCEDIPLDGWNFTGRKGVRDEVTNEFGQFVEKQRKGLFGAYICRCLLLGYEM